MDTMNNLFTQLVDMVEIAIQAIGSPIQVHAFPKGHPRYNAPGLTLNWQYHESDQGDRLSIILSRNPTVTGTPDKPNGFRLYPVAEDGTVYGTQEYYLPEDAVARAVGWMAERQIRAALLDYQSWQQQTLNHEESE